MKAKLLKIQVDIEVVVDPVKWDMYKRTSETFVKIEFLDIEGLLLSDPKIEFDGTAETFVEFDGLGDK
jgi:hypothetical protein